MPSPRVQNYFSLSEAAPTSAHYIPSDSQYPPFASNMASDQSATPWFQSSTSDSEAYTDNDHTAQSNQTRQQLESREHGPFDSLLCYNPVDYLSTSDAQQGFISEYELPSPSIDRSSLSMQNCSSPDDGPTFEAAEPHGENSLPDTTGRWLTQIQDNHQCEAAIAIETMSPSRREKRKRDELEDPAESQDRRPGHSFDATQLQAPDTRTSISMSRERSLFPRGLDTIHPPLFSIESLSIAFDANTLTEAETLPPGTIEDVDIPVDYEATPMTGKGRHHLLFEDSSIYGAAGNPDAYAFFDIDDGLPVAQLPPLELRSVWNDFDLPSSTSFVYEPDEAGS
jgi:hypothetical protein